MALDLETRQHLIETVLRNENASFRSKLVKQHAQQGHLREKYAHVVTL